MYGLILCQIAVEACDVVHGELAGCDVHQAAAFALGGLFGTERIRLVDGVAPRLIVEGAVEGCNDGEALIGSQEFAELERGGLVVLALHKGDAGKEVLEIREIFIALDVLPQRLVSTALSHDVEMVVRTSRGERNGGKCKSASLEQMVDRIFHNDLNREIECISFLFSMSCGSAFSAPALPLSARLSLCRSTPQRAKRCCNRDDGGTRREEGGRRREEEQAAREGAGLKGRIGITRCPRALHRCKRSGDRTRNSQRRTAMRCPPDRT